MSALQASSSVTNKGYVYQNEDEIDCALKCIICEQAFVKPVFGVTCEHTFCCVCIDEWCKRNPSCPSCRQTTTFKPLTNRIVLSQLDRLLVRCQNCNENRIERGRFDHHIMSQCRGMQMNREASDVKCSGTGEGEERVQDLAVRPLLQIRLIIEELRNEITALADQLQILRSEVRQQPNDLQNQRTRQVKQVVSFRMHLAVKTSKLKSKREIMSDTRYNWTSNCDHAKCDICTTGISQRYQCLVCSRTVRREHVGLHDMNQRNSNNIICAKCNEEHGEASESSYEL